MDPEIRQAGPGICPKCGMALEPELAALEDDKNTELDDMTRRFWIASALSLPVLILGMLETQPLIQLLLATPVVLWAGWPLLQRAGRVFRQSQPQHVHTDRYWDRRCLHL